MKNLFIAATSQNVGKTTVSLGLISAFQERTHKIGFIKPVGQRYLQIERGKFDEDAILIDEVCSTTSMLEDMSPVTVGRGFTKDFIEGKIKHDLDHEITAAYDRVRADADVVVVEGTGHAGVGAVMGVSNAHVARLLDAPVLIIAVGGVGRPIDEVALNYEFFRSEGVHVMGVILNKVAPSKLDMVNTITRKGLEKLGTPLLGAIPSEPLLAGPTMAQILQETKGTLLNGFESLGNHVERIVVGAMTPHQFLNHCGPNVLVITGGDREDLILAAMSCSSAGMTDHVSGLVLTGGIRPHQNILRLIERTGLPVIVVPGDSYQTASKVHDLTAKIQPSDSRKIETVRRLIKQYADVNTIFDSMV